MQLILVLTLFLLPTYVVRFSIFGLPANLLMLWVILVWIFFAYWLIKNKLASKFVSSVYNADKKELVLISFFILSGIISLFVFGLTKTKMGQFVVLFLQPITLFFIFKFWFQELSNAKEIFIRSAIVFLGLSGLLAAFQYFTLVWLPVEYMGNSIEPKRALSFFEYPNAYALFVAPLIAFTLPKIIELLNSLSWSNLRFRLFPIVSWSIGVFGLLLSLSRGGWLSVSFTAVLAILLIANKKIKKISVAIAFASILLVFSVPVLRYRLILPFLGEKSSVSRISLGETAVKMIKDTPVFGKGLLGYDTNFEKFNTDPNVQHYKYPHNLVLTLWVELGLLGLISFWCLIIYYIYKSYQGRKNIYFVSSLLFILAILTHGLVDVPYFKNDLAMLFFLVLSFGSINAFDNGK